MGICFDEVEKNMNFCFLYPGQGSQKVGMADFLLSDKEAIDLIIKADDILDSNLSKLIFEGPVDELTLTKNAQPALLAVGYAAHKYWIKKYKFKPIAAAGHSLGEYTALAAAGAISYETALKVVKKRGEAMQDAVEKGKGGMVALLGAGRLQGLIESCKDSGCLVPANFNTSNQTVLSGDIDAIDRVVEKAKGFGYIKAIKLKVSAPFHSPLMEKAKKKMIKVINEIDVSVPKWPVASNFTGFFHEEDSSKIKQNLINQIEGSVKWVQNLKELSKMNFEGWLDVGPGKVLFNMVPKADVRKKINHFQVVGDIIR